MELGHEVRGAIMLLNSGGSPWLPLPLVSNELWAESILNGENPNIKYILNNSLSTTTSLKGENPNIKYI